MSMSTSSIAFGNDLIVEQNEERCSPNGAGSEWLQLQFVQCDSFARVA